MSSKDNWRNFIFVLAIEAGYFFASRHLSERLPWDSISAEIMKTILRLLTAYLDWILLREVITTRLPSKTDLNSLQLLIAGSLAYLAVPVVMGNYGLSSPANYVFAIASIFAAVKEEIFFRGILINILDRKYSSIISILASSIIFTLWHVGVTNPSLWNFVQIFLAGTFLGLVYVGTGSLLLVIAFHALYDALFALSPFFRVTIGIIPGLILLIISVVFISIWLKSINRLVKNSGQTCDN